MPTDMPAVDLPGIEPTSADLAAIESLPWQETQAHLEELLTEAAITPVHRAVLAPVHQLSSYTPVSREWRTAA